MSSRTDHRRRDRSWERDDRDRNSRSGGRGGGGEGRRNEGRRSSRSRSPPRRGGGGDRRGESDRRDHRRDRDDERRDRDRRDDRRRDDRPRDREREDRKDPLRRDDDGPRRSNRPREPDSRDRPPVTAVTRQQSPHPAPAAPASPPHARPNLDPDVSEEHIEEGEEMDATNDDDAAMMAMMGLGGFGTTKGKHVEGNQEGGVSVKKIRTWRQYMNRRGGFNRPLDKIK